MKKSKLTFLTLAILSLTLLPAEAQEGAFTLNVGPTVSYLRYEEPGLMDESGMMYGVHAALEANLTDIIYLGLEGQITYGQLDYDSNGTGSVDNIDNWMLEPRVLAGLHIPNWMDIKMGPYMGLGYRFLADQLGGKISSTGHLGYDRYSNYLYVPIGFKLDKTFDSNWELGFTIEYDYFVLGKQYSELGDVSSSYDTLENDQNDGFGAKSKIHLGYRFDDFNLVFEPFVQYWDIDESDTNTSCGSACVAGYEPKNESLEAGVRIGFEF